MSAVEVFPSSGAECLGLSAFKPRRMAHDSAQLSKGEFGKFTIQPAR